MQPIIMSLVVVFGIAMIAAGLRPRPALKLKKSFERLEPLAGRTKDEIIAAAGAPTSFSMAEAGKSLLQWQRTTATGAFHIALLFGADGVCEAVRHQHYGTK